MLTQGTANAGDSIFYDYRINHSCRFDGASYLSKNLPQNNVTNSFTFSAWVKKASLSETLAILGATYTQSGAFRVTFFGFDGSDDKVFYFQHNNDSGFNINIKSTALTRDTSNWYHVVLSHNRTNNTSTVYVNGSSTGYWTNTSTTSSSQALNSSYTHYIGCYVGNGGGGGYYGHFKGYMANLQFIDGQALDPYWFGEMRNNIWIPYNAFTTANSNSVVSRSSNGGIAYDNYGDNGFHLLFDDPGHATGFGKDSSGKWNHFIESP